VEQYRDTGWEADANYKANSFLQGGVRKGFVSIETQGYGAGAWTAEQLAAIKDLLTWLSQTHGFPLAVPSSPVGPGVGFHTLFSDWTPYNKSCPGPERIKQYRDVLVPWMAQSKTPMPEIRRRLRAKIRAARSETRKAWLRSLLAMIRKGPQ
jgi:hypothetical protein